MATEMNKTYNPSEIEDRLYKKWMDKKYFHAEVDRSKKPFTIVMPPPNITGQLHMGHALDNTLQDILIRFKRMQGYNALWQPGTDHASIATEVKVTNKLKEEGIDKEELGREGFLKRTWEWNTSDIHSTSDNSYPVQSDYTENGGAENARCACVLHPAGDIIVMM